MDQQRKQQLGEKVIDDVINLVEGEVHTLQWRADQALKYMDMVERPNFHTLAHIRRYLTGGYDQRAHPMQPDRADTEQDQHGNSTVPDGGWEEYTRSMQG